MYLLTKQLEPSPPTLLAYFKKKCVACELCVVDGFFKGILRNYRQFDACSENFKVIILQTKDETMILK